MTPHRNFGANIYIAVTSRDVTRSIVPSPVARIFASIAAVSTSQLTASQIPQIVGGEKYEKDVERLEARDKL